MRFDDVEAALAYLEQPSADLNDDGSPHCPGECWGYLYFTVAQMLAAELAQAKTSERAFH